MYTKYTGLYALGQEVKTALESKFSSIFTDLFMICFHEYENHTGHFRLQRKEHRLYN